MPPTRLWTASESAVHPAPVLNAPGRRQHSPAASRTPARRLGHGSRFHCLTAPELEKQRKTSCGVIRWPALGSSCWLVKNLTKLSHGWDVAAWKSLRTNRLLCQARVLWRITIKNTGKVEREFTTGCCQRSFEYLFLENSNFIHSSRCRS